MAETFNPWKEFPPSGRGLDEYLKFLELTRDDLAGKKILDIGSGLNQCAEDIKKERLRADVVPFDYFYSLPQHARENLYKNRYDEKDFVKVKEALGRVGGSGLTGELVAGRAEKLPFRDESFDMVICFFSMPLYAESREQAGAFMREVERVLKKGGTARIYPSRYGGKGDIPSTRIEREYADALEHSSVREIRDRDKFKVTIIEKNKEKGNAGGAEGY
ncbi:MAG: hypothetical protein A2934_01765 [Candidatus Sungbacteria bacterium RIFCSPLOWO2_01_FULL_47_10]|uniref:Methyltransferase type 11 domain-containing protein n=1 Tax=Candidatus Sungbacteria bacterium RIFCSPLOWO2_01_FULL_47_10 TaxID=1802276 RepID=A0A1G2L1W5_9BACT|nr:MAG: hypothetical protein A2934_01765 [Candidatus Sungbacteria bacterium RIFCSPLOWO2_01_FULL_47_10]